MRALAWSVLRDRTAMDDALQDAYLKAYRNLDRFRGESRFSTWLHRIVYRTCLDHVRRRRDLVLLADDVGPAGADPARPRRRRAPRHPTGAGLPRPRDRGRAGPRRPRRPQLRGGRARARHPGRHGRQPPAPGTSCPARRARPRPLRSAWRDPMNEHRDTLVGDALRRLDVPDHAPDFWDRLDAGLAAGQPDGRRPADDRPAAGGDADVVDLARGARRSHPTLGAATSGRGSGRRCGRRHRARRSASRPLQQAADGDAQVDMADVPDDARARRRATGAGHDPDDTARRDDDHHRSRPGRHPAGGRGAGRRVAHPAAGRRGRCGLRAARRRRRRSASPRTGSARCPAVSLKVPVPSAGPR